MHLENRSRSAPPDNTRLADSDTGEPERRARSNTTVHIDRGFRALLPDKPNMLDISDQSFQIDDKEGDRASQGGARLSLSSLSRFTAIIEGEGPNALELLRGLRDNIEAEQIPLKDALIDIFTGAFRFARHNAFHTQIEDVRRLVSLVDETRDVLRRADTLDRAAMVFRRELASIANHARLDRTIIIPAEDLPPEHRMDRNCGVVEMALEKLKNHLIRLLCDRLENALVPIRANGVQRG